MLALKFVIRFINLLNKDATPPALAGGLALGAIAGITPTASLHNLALLLVVMMIRVNFSGAMLGWAVFSGVGALLDPLSNRIGYALLVEVTPLRPLWTWVYNTPVLPWFRLHNTLTLGSLVLALLLLAPLYLALRWAIIAYRQKVMARVNKWRIVTVLKASNWFSLWRRLS
jgi:uncharacterized protein (TIGR03546 family)